MVKESSMNTQEAFQTDTKLQVGSRVSFLFGRDRLTGFVVEDRGAIGRGGRHLFRIEVPFEGESPLVTEMPADQLQPA